MTPLLNQNNVPILDANRKPVLCQNICKVSSEPNRDRLGFRWRCSGVQIDPRTGNTDRTRHHDDIKLSPHKGSIFRNAKIDYRKFLKILLGFAKESSFEKLVSVVKGSRTTTADYLSTIRDALAVCGWHDMRKIGKIFFLT